MGTGYTRNDTPNNIADGNVINASDLDGEFDAVQAAFNGSTGHSHDGTTGEGPQIATAGLADNAVTTAKITDANVTTAKIADDAVTSAKLDTNIQIAGTLGVTGETTLTTHLNMGDNDIIKLGDSADLQIYHNSTNSYVRDVGVGKLHITSDGTGVSIDKGTSELMATFDIDGAVTLYHDASPKLATTATGIDVTGTATMDGLTVDGNATFNAGNYVNFANNGYIRTDAANELRLQSGTSGIRLRNSSNGKDLALFADNNDISFYEDTGTTPKMVWDASAESLGIGTATPAPPSGSDTTLEIAGSASPSLTINDTGQAEKYMLTALSNDLAIYYGSTRIVSFQNDGNVGIGTDNPTVLLDLESTSPTIKFTDSDASGTPECEISGAGGDLTLRADKDNEKASSIIGFEVDGTERMRITSTGIDVTGTATMDGLTVDGTASTSITSTNGNILNLYRSGTGSDSVAINFYDGSNDRSQIKSSDGGLSFHINGTTRAVDIDASGNLLVGTTTSFNALNGRGDIVAGNGSSNGGMTIYTGSSNQGAIAFADGTSGDQAYRGMVEYDHSTDSMAFKTAVSTRMTINSAGNVGIGTTTALSGPSSATALRIGNQISIYELDDGGNPVQMNINQNIDASENYIVSDHAARYQMRDGVHKWFNVASGTAGAATSISAAEKMQLDTSGNLLVGKTSAGLSTTGSEFASDGLVRFTRSNVNAVVNFNKKDYDGDIVSFRKDGTTVGTIGNTSGQSYFYIVNDGGCGIAFGNTNAFPANGTGSLIDNAKDLGGGATRWDDVYATNGTIQTSDRNEKQDIEELSEAEQRVAVVAKGLMRKFRWKSAVAEKGDNARTHFGIIAQDLQDAFTAEGLDASDYAMFTSNTWWEKEISVDAVEADEENGIEAKDAYTYMDTKEEATEGYTEKTRLGVRYNQLLAFIISAI